MKGIPKLFIKTTWGVFIIFTFTIFVKCILFHYYCFGYVAITSFWSSTIDFFAFYVTKLFPSVLIASFVFLTQKQWWTIVVSVLIDIWMLSNYIYFRSYGLFIDIGVIALAGNLSGFGNSILAYINWKSLIFLLLTILYSIYVVCCNVKGRNLLSFCICFTFALVLYGCDLLSYTGKVFHSSDSRISQVKMIAEGKRPSSMTYYIECSSILHYFPVMFIFEKYKSDYIETYAKNVKYSESEKNTMQTLFYKEGSNDTVQTNLIIILVESLESWTLQFKDEKKRFVSPCLNRFIDTSGSLLFCSKIKSQAMYGCSGDGQMIVNTGLLPIQNGAACMLYGKNRFPNIAHYYKDAICVNTTNNNVWNQCEMNSCYHYNDYVYPDKSRVEDEGVFNLAYEKISKKTGLMCTQIITISTHAPFDPIGNVNLPFKNDMPQNMRGYLNNIHYTDSCIGNFIHRLDSQSLLSNSTIVITGDHTVFKKSLLEEFSPFSHKYNYSIPCDESYCPLIIYSPFIKSKKEINDLCYQMDIFPTILHCIGVNDYYWRGFGVNVLDSFALSNRKVTEKEAYILSDKMIRDNYFYKMKNEK